MLEAACREAEDVLLDQAFFTADEGTFAKFQVLLDHPLPPTDKLRRLLKAKASWGGMITFDLTPPTPIIADRDLSNFDSGEFSLNEWLNPYLTPSSSI